MPPEGIPQPDEKDRAAAAAWIHSQLDTYATQVGFAPAQPLSRAAILGRKRLRSPPMFRAATAAR